MRFVKTSKAGPAHLGRREGRSHMATPKIEMQHADGAMTLILRGALQIGDLEQWQSEMTGIAPGSGAACLDLGAVSKMDVAGAWLIADLCRTLSERNIAVSLRNTSEQHLELIDAVSANLPTPLRKPPRYQGIRTALANLGEMVASGGRILVELTNFLGLILARIAGLLVHPRRLRVTALTHHMQEIGLKALPVVSLMSFLIGVVIAYQGATQLRQFGAQVFVADLIAISVLRELGVLLTAIIVAGRSGSAFTAAIGSMKMREEIDALKTLSLDPIEVVVIPRVVAIVLVLPILSLIADIAGLVGGALMAWAELGVSPGMFQARIVDVIHPNHFLVGMAKAPFFAVIIGVIGCFEGMKVKGDTESLGRRTSRSVVFAIFMVIVVDALFSIFFSLVNI